eukprot:Phypoly_transcript_07517.p1 GENE.Phypoly_transcript_07517~~Phypoly_transcript_07517.p1  ORF type:complete len:488 (+),score=74.44 Phypoly_transcript_07517:52-1515(+)
MLCRASSSLSIHGRHCKGVISASCRVSGWTSRTVDCRFHSNTRGNQLYNAIRYPFNQRTSVTNQLCAARNSLKSLAQSSANGAPVTGRTPAESLLETTLPFSSDTALREQYVSPFGHIRIGRILEDLDAMAGSVAYLHADDGISETRDKTIVTASVDRIQLLDNLHADYDYRIRGYITWVGRSSMEIRLELLAYKEPKEKPNDSSVILVAYFTMAARDAKTMRASPVNKLIVQNAKQQKFFDQGELHKQKRLQFAEKSLTKSPPTPEESLAIHEVFMKQLLKAQSAANPALPQVQDNELYVPMSSTKYGTTILCQPQERNIHGKIFGGYLMRKGFELAFSTAYLFGKSLPFFFAMDDVTFYKPVEIGDILSLEATVTYTERRDFSRGSYYGIGSAQSDMVKTVVENSNTPKQTFVHVEVTAYVSNPKLMKKHTTNTFNFTFICPEDTQHEIVAPQTYEEAMKFIEGKRRVERHLEFVSDPTHLMKHE